MSKQVEYTVSLECNYNNTEIQHNDYFVTTSLEEATAEYNKRISEANNEAKYYDSLLATRSYEERVMLVCSRYCEKFFEDDEVLEAQTIFEL